MGTAATVLAGCGVPLGMLDGSSDGSSDGSAPIDASPPPQDASAPVDATPPPQDSGASGTCPAGVMPVGRPEDFALDTPRLVNSGTFVIRDARGLYAMSATCTHRGCTVAPVASGFRCPCHSATFDRNGAVTGGPAPTALEHYAMCVLADGRLGIAFGEIVAADVRLTP